jgi:hypothetical protein
MALLRREAAKESERESAASLGERLLSHCGNPRCATGWMQLWRSRHAPLFDGKWTCSANCLQELILSAIVRETGGGASRPSLRSHRMPLGLVLLEQGWLTAEQLQKSLGQQRIAAGAGNSAPLGQWLVREGLIDETALARALGAQWGCPAFSLGDGYQPLEVTSALPHFLARAFAAVPLRMAGGEQLYVAFSGSVDRSLTYVLERILRLRVTAGILPDAEFGRAHAAFLGTPGPAVRMIEAGNPALLARQLARLIEKEKPAGAAMAGLHGYGWLRMWKRADATRGLPRREDVSDLLCTIGRIDGNDWSES